MILHKFHRPFNSHSTNKFNWIKFLLKPTMWIQYYSFLLTLRLKYLNKRTVHTGPWNVYIYYEILKIPSGQCVKFRDNKVYPHIICCILVFLSIPILCWCGYYLSVIGLTSIFIANCVVIWDHWQLCHTIMSSRCRVLGSIALLCPCFFISTHHMRFWAISHSQIFPLIWFLLVP